MTIIFTIGSCFLPLSTQVHRGITPTNKYKVETRIGSIIVEEARLNTEEEARKHAMWRHDVWTITLTPVFQAGYDNAVGSN